MAGIFVVAAMLVAYKRDMKGLSALKHKTFMRQKQAVADTAHDDDDNEREEGQEEEAAEEEDDDRQGLLQRDSMSDEEGIKAARMSIASWSEFDNNNNTRRSDVISYSTTVGPARSKYTKRPSKSKTRPLFALQLY